MSQANNNYYPKTFQICIGFGITGKISSNKLSILKDGDFSEDLLTDKI
jgi:hypothetical protein